jgi:hypothetical protein
MTDAVKVRACSFDLLFFLLPQDWDGGKGYDYTETFFNQGYYGKRCGGLHNDTARLLSRDGSNWYQAQTIQPWPEEGVYSNETMSKEYDKFSSEEGSTIIIGRQHFDIGNENINFDITDIVNKYITGELENHGIGIAFTPMLELVGGDIENYIGFLTHYTSSFFEPYVETSYEDCIEDDRANFVLDKDNKLYLYANIGGIATNLDALPTCEVDGTSYEVKQFSTGIYYIDINLHRSDFKPHTMHFDTWGNIQYQGTKLDDVELDFTTKDGNMYFNVGNSLEPSKRLVPTVYGIQHDEEIQRGDIRKVVINPRVEYKRNSSELVDKMYFRLYVKDGEREIDVIPFQKVNRTFLENYITIDTEMLIPNKYYMDVKLLYNQEMIVHHNVLSFKITQNLDNKYA